MTAPGKTKVEVYREDLPRIALLGALLSAEGPGRFRQAETIRWLLDFRDAQAAEQISRYERTPE